MRKELQTMKPYTIRPNNLTEQVIDELIENYHCSKGGAFDLLVEKYVHLQKENERLIEELDESRKIQKGILRDMETKMNVLYELENTNQIWQAYTKYKPSSEQKSEIVKNAEEFVEVQRKEKLFHHFEQHVGK